MRVREGKEIPYYTSGWSWKAREIEKRTSVLLACRLLGYHSTAASAQILAPCSMYAVVIHVQVVVIFM